MKNKIQDFNCWHWLTKVYVKFAIRQFYGKIDVIGKNNIPQDKAVIFAPNHQNALMDALLVLYVQPGRIVFLARADIFKNKKVASILNFLKILPIYRIRDGRNELDKNYEIFEKSIDVLRDNVPLCLMPEGLQSFKRKLLPLVKGMFRIAFQAQEELPEKEVVIIPVGIDYTDYINSGANVRIEFGKGIPVEQFMDSYNEQPAKGLNMLRDVVSERISKLIQDIRSEKYYENFYEISTIYSLLEFGDKKHSQEDLFISRKNTSLRLDQLGKENPEKTEKIVNTQIKLTEILKEHKITYKEITNKPSVASIIPKILFYIISFPLFLFGWISNCIPAYFPRIIVRKLKEDSFKSSFNFVLWLVLFLLFYMIIFLSVGFSVSWLYAFILTLMMSITGKFAYHYLKWVINLKRNICYLNLSNEMKEKISSLIEQLFIK